VLSWRKACIDIARRKSWLIQFLLLTKTLRCYWLDPHTFLKLFPGEAGFGQFPLVFFFPCSRCEPLGTRHPFNTKSTEGVSKHWLDPLALSAHHLLPNSWGKMCCSVFATLMIPVPSLRLFQTCASCWDAAFLMAFPIPSCDVLHSQVPSLFTVQD